MRIGIDCTLLRDGRLTGVERYATELVRSLACRVPGAMVLFTGPGAPESIVRLDVEQHRAPLGARLPVDQLWLPIAAVRARVELLHNLAFPTPPLWRGPAVLTVHDAAPWLYRDTLSYGMHLYYGPLFAQALRRAAAVVTVSESARGDIARAAGVPAERIRITREGVRRELFSLAEQGSEGRPYLLFVGTAEPRKNLGSLVEAFRLLLRAGRELDLVIAGRRGWGPRLDLKDVSACVRVIGVVSDAELASLYRGAACFVLPSRYEGFGLTVLEAMAAGTPVVASDIPALRELGAGTVRYADTEKPGALAGAIAACLDDAGETAKLAAAARRRAAQYSWDRCAEETLAVYSDVVRLRGRGSARA